MSHAEFVEWAAFAAVEPLPQARADLHTAMQMLLHLSINRKKGSKKLTLEKMMPDWWRDRRSPRALEAKFRALTAHLDQPDQAAEDEEDGERNRVVGGQAGARRRGV
jgi:hypothetical protein